VQVWNGPCDVVCAAERQTRRRAYELLEEALQREHAPDLERVEARGLERLT